MLEKNMHAKDPNLRIVSNQFQTANKSKLMQNYKINILTMTCLKNACNLFFDLQGKILSKKKPKTMRTLQTLKTAK